MIKQKIIFKIVDYEVEDADTIESYAGLDEASENDLISGAEEGFMMGYMGA